MSMTASEDIMMKPDFTKTHAFEKLETLAKKAVDLSDPEVLTPERLEKYQASACGYRLLYGTERVDDAVMQALEELAEETEALGLMRQMQGGAVLNNIEGFSSENRSVLHTATRDFFDNPQTEKAAADGAKMAKEELKKLRDFMQKLENSSRFTDLIMIGIGGSDLGPRAIYQALQAYKKPDRRVHFISNVDPDDAAAVLEMLPLERCLVVVISKSGNTIETATNEAFVRTRFLAEGVDPQNHFVAVTGKGSPMDNPKNYLESFYIWDWIGGRYSSCSMVGGVMLSFAYGCDLFEDFLRGAHGMDQTALEQSLQQNLPLLSALLGIWNRNFLQLPTLAIIPYSQALSRFPAHIQQLDMESNGKQIDRYGRKVNFHTGPIIWGEPGTNAQHSFFQLLHQGTDIVPMMIIGFKQSQYLIDAPYQGTTSQEKLLANLFAQALGLASGKNSEHPNKNFPGNRPSHILLGKRLTPFSLGALLSFFEHKTAFQGFIWGINSFDQEGVQLGKVLANQILSSTPFPLAETWINILTTL